MVKKIAGSLSSTSRKYIHTITLTLSEEKHIILTHCLDMKVRTNVRNFIQHNLLAFSLLRYCEYIQMETIQENVLIKQCIKCLSSLLRYI